MLLSERKKMKDDFERLTSGGTYKVEIYVEKLAKCNEYKSRSLEEAQQAYDLWLQLRKDKKRKYQFEITKYGEVVNE